MSENNLNKRKSDHIELAFQSQLTENDDRFIYEPLFCESPKTDFTLPINIGEKVMNYPLWISSMTGGAEKAGEINKNLALVAAKFKLGMGLGSCRPVLENPPSASDFAVRKYIGDQPLFVNLGIAQIEELIEKNQLNRIHELIENLESDGLIIHLNPLQEWFQPEGDHFRYSPLVTIKKVLDFLKYPIMVKEVGQGFGPKSMEALLKLPLEAVDFGSFGGTNFSLLENLRRDDVRKETWLCATHVGHTAEEMSNWATEIIERAPAEINTKTIIVSGGIKTFLDGYYHINKIPHQAMYAHASQFLKYALLGESALTDFVESQIQGLSMAHSYLTVKKK